MEKIKRIFNVSIIIHLLIAVIVGIVLVFAGYFFFNGILKIPENRIDAAKTIYFFMIVSTMITVTTVPYEAVLNAHENMLYFSIVGVFESLAKLGAAIIVVYTLTDKLIIYGAMMAGISLLVMLAMRFYCHKTYQECQFSPVKYWDKILMKEMTSFAGWNFLSISSSMISQYGLGIVLNSFWGSILNSAQAIANQISGQLMVFSNTIMKALNPVIAKSEGSGNRNMMLTAALTGTKFTYVMLAFFAIPFIIEAPYILKIWLKNVPEWAVVFTRLQLSRSIIEQLTVMIGGTISAQGEIKEYSMIKSGLNILPILLTTILFYFGFPPYVLYIVWIFSMGILGGILTLYYSKQKCGLKISDYYKKVAIPCLIISGTTLLTAIIPTFLMEENFKRLLIVILMSSSAFLISLWFILTKEEKQLATNFIAILKNRLGTGTSLRKKMKSI